jgi:hypothetical protein
VLSRTRYSGNSVLVISTLLIPDWLARRLRCKKTTNHLYLACPQVAPELLRQPRALRQQPRPPQRHRLQPVQPLHQHGVMCQLRLDGNTRGLDLNIWHCQSWPGFCHLCESGSWGRS